MPSVSVLRFVMASYNVWYLKLIKYTLYSHYTLKGTDYLIVGVNLNQTN